MTRNQKRVLIALGWYDYRLHRGIEKFAQEHGWHLSANLTREKVIPWGWEGDGILAWLGEGDVVSVHRWQLLQRESQELMTSQDTFAGPDTGSLPVRRKRKAFRSCARDLREGMTTRQRGPEGAAMVSFESGTPRQDNEL